MVYDCLETLRKNETPGSIYQALVRSDDARYLAWILAALTPWSAIPLPPYNTAGKQPLPLGALAAREGVKLENKLCNVVTGAFRHYEQIITLKEAITHNLNYIQERDTLGMDIRRWESHGGHWRLQALFALFVEVISKSETSSKLFTNLYPLLLISISI